MHYLYQSLGSMLYYIYKVVPDYGISIVIFTILIKLILLPFAIKQQKAMAGMQKIQPQMEELRKKYKDNAAKLNEETMKLYSEHKVNPFGSCLPTLIQLPIFIALYQVITHPIIYILRYSDNQLLAINHVLNYIRPEKITTELQIIKGSEELVAKANGDVIGFITNSISHLSQYQHNYLVGILNREGITQLDQVAKLLADASTNLSMNFLGLFNLTEQPSLTHITPVILIPLLAGLTTYLSSKISMAMNPSMGDNPTQASMLIMMPLFTTYLGFTLPAGLGLYWIISNVVQIIQQYFLNKFLPYKGVDSK